MKKKELTIVLSLAACGLYALFLIFYLIIA